MGENHKSFFASILAFPQRGADESEIGTHFLYMDRYKGAAWGAGCVVVWLTECNKNINRWNVCVKILSACVYIDRAQKAYSFE